MLSAQLKELLPETWTYAPLSNMLPKDQITKKVVWLNSKGSLVKVNKHPSKKWRPNHKNREEYNLWFWD